MDFRRTFVASAFWNGSVPIIRGSINPRFVNPTVMYVL